MCLGLGPGGLDFGQGLFETSIALNTRFLKQILHQTQDFIVHFLKISVSKHFNLTSSKTLTLKLFRKEEKEGVSPDWSCVGFLSPSVAQGVTMLVYPFVCSSGSSLSIHLSLSIYIILGFWLRSFSSLLALLPILEGHNWMRMIDNSWHA